MSDQLEIADCQHTLDAFSGLWICGQCGDIRKRPARRNCQAPPIQPGRSTNTSVIAALPPDDRLLLGDRVELLLKAIGFPPCGGCQERKAWLNRAHAWLVGG